MAFSMKASGLDQLQRELAAIPDEILDEAERIVGKGMSQIKSGAVRRVRAAHPAHLPHVTRSYSYDVTRRGYVVRGEAGADMEKLQGKLDVYYELGTATSPAHHQWALSLDEELPRFEKYADDLLADLFK